MTVSEEDGKKAAESGEPKKLGKLGRLGRSPRAGSAKKPAATRAPLTAPAETPAETPAPNGSEPGVAGIAQPTGKKTRDRANSLVVGGEPRVSLLPPSIRQKRRQAKTARYVGLGLVGVMVLVAAAIVATTFIAGQMNQQLVDEQAQTQSILQQQGKFVEVNAVQDQVGLTKAAQQVGASTEIDWKGYLTKVQNTLPETVVITSVSLDSSSPLGPYAQATAPLQGSRVATLTFTVTSPTLPEVPVWLDALATLPGFADAVPGTVTMEADGTYTSDITLHVNEKAFDGRFQTKKDK
jgi:Tfp pilus assembly protein PilN